MNDTDAPRPMDNRWSARDSTLLVLVTLVAGILRIGGIFGLTPLGEPEGLVFDETYYAKDACWYVEASTELCDRGAGDNEVHPPLGKWLIGLGIEIFGHDEFGWRIAAAIAGMATVALVYLLARRLLRSSLGATLASGLLALDFLHFVQSRIAMLDIFVPLFGVAAFLFAVYDRDAMRAALRDNPTGVSGLRRPWRIAAGLSAAAAIASKWSGAFFVIAVLVLVVAWGIGARRAEGFDRPVARMLREEGASIAVWLIAAPVVLYMLTYVGRFGDGLSLWPWADASWFGAFWREQMEMFEFHREGVTATHRYSSPAWSWLLLKIPVAYYFENVPQSNDYIEVMGLGNPFVWWASIPAVLYVAYNWVRERSLDRPEGVILAGFVFTYVPWLLLDLVSERTATFLFYLVPTVPFMCLALAYVATRMGDILEARLAIALFSVGALLTFGFFYPVLAAKPLTRTQWERRILFEEACAPEEDAAAAETATGTATATATGTETATATGTGTGTDGGDLPPQGWCWI